MKVAAVDIGTNTCLLLIVELPHPQPLSRQGERGAITVIRDEARITGLGRGLRENFYPESVARTLKALEEFDQIRKKEKVEKVVCVGTAAFRKAKDGPELIQKISKQFGWEARIISGEEEARLSYLSVEHDFGDQYKNIVALDIGGGSTEIISKECAVSLELGTVMLTEKYLKEDPPTIDEIQNLVQAIDLKIHPSPLFQRGENLVALAGTPTTLSSINQKLKKWDPEKIQGSIITLPDLDAMIFQFQRMTHEDLSKIPGMVPGREAFLLTGALLLKEVMKKFQTNRVIVSDRGLRYGLIYS